jgi:hypothetical protein
VAERETQRAEAKATKEAASLKPDVKPEPLAPAVRVARVVPPVATLGPMDDPRPGWLWLGRADGWMKVGRDDARAALQRGDIGASIAKNGRRDFCLPVRPMINTLFDSAARCINRVVSFPELRRTQRKRRFFLQKKGRTGGPRCPASLSTLDASRSYTPVFSRPTPHS